MPRKIFRKTGSHTLISRGTGEEKRKITPTISRRSVLQKTGLASALAGVLFLESCVSSHPDFLNGKRIPREHGFGVEFSTRSPSSVKRVIEAFPRITTEEIGFIKEAGKPGRMVGASATRNHFSTHLVSVNREVRSVIHTHPLIRMDDVAIHGFPSSADFSNFLNRSKKEPGSIQRARIMHVVPVSPKGEVIGYTSVFF
ncbi:MAG: hypothetical protein AABY11_00350, partial [archaeon]